MVPFALRQLCVVDPRVNGIDAKGAQILDIGIDDAVESLRVIQDFDLQGFAGRIAPHPVIANRPARLVEKRRGASQIAPVQLAF